MNPLVSLTGCDSPIQMVNQQPQLPLEETSDHLLTNNFMAAKRPSAHETQPAITPKSLAFMVTEVNMAALSNQSLAYSSSPSSPPLHEHVMGGLDTSQVAAHATDIGQASGSKLSGEADTDVQSYLLDLKYFLAGKVKPGPGIQIYKCCMCGDEFASRHALGGHMSAHSKRNAAAKRGVAMSKSAKCTNYNSNKKSKKNSSSMSTKI